MSLKQGPFQLYRPHKDSSWLRSVPFTPPHQHVTLNSRLAFGIRRNMLGMGEGHKCPENQNKDSSHSPSVWTWTKVHEGIKKKHGWYPTWTLHEPKSVMMTMQKLPHRFWGKKRFCCLLGVTPDIRVNQVHLVTPTGLAHSWHVCYEVLTVPCLRSVPYQACLRNKRTCDTNKEELNTSPHKHTHRKQLA